MTDLGARPNGDHIVLEFRLAPISQQARSETKEAFRQEVRRILRTSQYLLSGDVQIEVEWLVSEQVRYESDRAPDVDNILKPLLDSLAGPDGILIDDNQVQHVSCAWIDWNESGEALRVSVRFSPDEWILKHGLVFVQFHRALCLPIPNFETRDQRLGWVEAYKGVLLARTEADRQGLPYNWSRVLMPRQRVFHRTRIAAFPVVSEEDFRAQFPEEN
jgi:Holliday junction resolvase RusA-like endonuclease